MLFSLLPFGAGRNISNNCIVHTYPQLIDENGRVVDSGEIDRRWFPAGPEAPHEYTGIVYESAKELAGEVGHAGMLLSSEDFKKVRSVWVHRRRLKRLEDRG
jgi:hypothetical protein